MADEAKAYDPDSLSQPDFSEANPVKRDRANRRKRSLLETNSFRGDPVRKHAGNGDDFCVARVVHSRTSYAVANLQVGDAFTYRDYGSGAAVSETDWLV